MVISTTSKESPRRWTRRSGCRRIRQKATTAVWRLRLTDVNELAAVEEHVRQIREGLIAAGVGFASFHEFEGLIEALGIGFMAQREHEHALDRFFERV